MYEALMIQSLVSLAVIFAIILGVITIIKGSRSYRYRRELTNLYVAGKIRNIAKDDKVDLVVEYESFKKWLEKQRLEGKGLDHTAEEELKEKISEKK
jgi:biopolymer transport protein ExbB/TolQ